MDTKTQIAAAFAGGYLVGRARKAKLALAAAMWLSKRTPLSLDQMQQRVKHIPGLTGVSERLHPDMLKAAASGTAETAISGGGRLSGALGRAAKALRAEDASDGGQPAAEKAKKPASQAEASEKADDDVESKQAEKPTSRPRRKTASTQSKSAARKTAGAARTAAGGAAKKAPAPRKRASSASRSNRKSASGSEDDG
ncbi:hypothetical protein ABZZ36_41455 [Actinacidiphila glaucinigra]|uniref:hypothetical protein n=1 Tax=Actinacidiphila glaucinigra TaxID=235986 RepID=UPI0033B4F051